MKSEELSDILEKLKEHTLILNELVYKFDQLNADITPPSKDYDAIIRNFETRSILGDVDCIGRGNIYEDSKGRFDDGDYITTSVIEDIITNCNDKKRSIVKTKSSTYLVYWK